MTLQSRSRKALPIVGIPASFRSRAGSPFHMADESYVRAVTETVGAIPLIIPALGDMLDLDALLSTLDGILLTGSPSNVDPACYGGPASDVGTLHDQARDATTLPLITAAVDAGVPLLAICRGFQEMNVAFGGTLHQKLYQVPGRFDHREKDPTASYDVQFGLAHSVRLTDGGLLKQWLGTDSVMVNSLHGQGVDRLGDGLSVDAVAEDRTIEAFHATVAKAFAFGVQWHPEYRHAEYPVSRAIFGAFADAVRKRYSVQKAT